MLAMQHAPIELYIIASKYVAPFSYVDLINSLAPATYIFAAKHVSIELLPMSDARFDNGWCYIADRRLDACAVKLQHTVSAPLSSVRRRTQDQHARDAAKNCWFTVQVREQVATRVSVASTDVTQRTDARHVRFSFAMDASSAACLELKLRERDQWPALHFLVRSGDVRQRNQHVCAW